VGNVYDAIAALSEPSGKVKDLPSLGDAQRWGRFIHDNDARIKADAFRDRD
jgi:hypothetical protein